MTSPIIRSSSRDKEIRDNNDVQKEGRCVATAAQFHVGVLCVINNGIYQSISDNILVENNWIENEWVV